MFVSLKTQRHRLLKYANKIIDVLTLITSVPDFFVTLSPHPYSLSVSAVRVEKFSCVVYHVWVRRGKEFALVELAHVLSCFLRRNGSTVIGLFRKRGFLLSGSGKGKTYWLYLIVCDVAFWEESRCNVGQVAWWVCIHICVLIVRSVSCHW